MWRRVGIVGAASWLLAVGPGPAGRAETAAQTPQFRAGTDIVPIDFLAYGPNGMPVTDLGIQDIRLLVDGRPREIKSFQFVKLAPTSVELPSAAPALPLPYGSNESLLPGRSVIIVVDHEQIRPAESKAAIEAAQAFIDRLTPLDRAAVVTLPNGRIEADLTTNHARVKAALGRVVGRAARRTGIWNISLNEALTVLAEVLDPDKVFTKELVDRECRFAPEESSCRTLVVQDALQYARETERMTRATLIALEGFLGGLGSVEAPIAVLFLSGGLVTFPDTHSYYEDVARAAARARVQMFVIQPHEPMLDTQVRDQPPTMGLDGDRRLSGLRDLAGVTGGEFVRLAGTGLPVFNRLADELASHYLLGFEPRAGEQDGKPHALRIETTRRDVTIRARPSFIVDDPKRLPPTPMMLETLLRQTTPRRDLPLRATAYTFRDMDPRHVKIVVALEPADEATTLRAAAFALIDVQGHAAAQWSEEGANIVTRPVLTAAAVPPGEYRLRVAALDSDGRRGTVDYEFVAELTGDRPLAFGTLMAGRMDRDTFRPRLVVPADATGVTGYVEFYGDLPVGTELSATFEVAASADGRALATGAGSVLGAPQATRFVATGTVPLGALPPGDYVLRARVAINDRPAGAAVRTIRLGR